MQIKTKKFLKPNIWKIILFIFLGVPPVLALSLDAQVLDQMPQISVLIMKLSGVWIFFCIMINSIFSIIGIIINIIVLWLIACLLYFIWNKLSKTKKIILIAALATILCGFLVYDLSASAIISNKIILE